MYVVGSLACAFWTSDGWYGKGKGKAEETMALLFSALCRSKMCMDQVTSLALNISRTRCTC